MKYLSLILALTLSFSTFSQKKVWIKLTDKNLDNWYAWKVNDGNSTTGWNLENGVLSTDGNQGDLVTKKSYGDFELEFEFKISPKGNSGVIYKVLDKKGEKDQPYVYGPEFQIIDDVNYPHKVNDSQKTSSNYDVQAPSDFTVVKPAGEWNKGKIIVKNNHIEHWLNGKMLVHYEYGSDKWKEDVAKSKFKNWEYAKPHHRGKISLQGHGDQISFKNIRIREL